MTRVGKNAAIGAWVSLENIVSNLHLLHYLDMVISEPLRMYALIKIRLSDACSMCQYNLCKPSESSE